MPASPLRPGFGPTLPALLQARLGDGARAALAVVAGAAALLAVAAALVALGGSDEQLVHDDDPVFNLVYDAGRLRPADPRGGELARLEGRRGRVSVAVTVRPLRVPPVRGDVAKGFLPLHAQLYMDRLRRRDRTFAIRDEGRSTVNDSPGYQIAYRTGSPGRFTYWREVFVVPDEEAPREGVVLAFRNRRPDRIGAPAFELVHAARSALRSFAFGTEAA
ncbi:MAG TPA: hypothetical protein VGW75_13695 [Solirubrobacteraceae bacterium]|jgi:hypothetical protein|nr:hypothetical protein [Solirubrobacteraceae bacterium]